MIYKVEGRPGYEINKMSDISQIKISESQAEQIFDFIVGSILGTLATGGIIGATNLTQVMIGNLVGSAVSSAVSDKIIQTYAKTDMSDAVDLINPYIDKLKEVFSAEQLKDLIQGIKDKGYLSESLTTKVEEARQLALKAGPPAAVAFVASLAPVADNAKRVLTEKGTSTLVGVLNNQDDFYNSKIPGKAAFAISAAVGYAANSAVDAITDSIRRAEEVQLQDEVRNQYMGHLKEEFVRLDKVRSEGVNDSESVQLINNMARARYLATGVKFDSKESEFNMDTDDVNYDFEFFSDEDGHILRKNERSKSDDVAIEETTTYDSTGTQVQKQQYRNSAADGYQFKKNSKSAEIISAKRGNILGPKLVSRDGGRFTITINHNARGNTSVLSPPILNLPRKNNPLIVFDHNGNFIKSKRTDALSSRDLEEMDAMMEVSSKESNDAYQKMKASSDFLRIIANQTVKSNPESMATNAQQANYETKESNTLDMDMPNTAASQPKIQATNNNSGSIKKAMDAISKGNKSGITISDEKPGKDFKDMMTTLAIENGRETNKGRQGRHTPNSKAMVSQS
jgi:uncharacterized protein (DUF697 family)